MEIQIYNIRVCENVISCGRHAWLS